MKNSLVASIVLALSFTLTNVTFADQIDHEAAFGQAPAGVLVKVNPATKTVEVFKAPLLDANIKNQTADSKTNEAAINRIENPLNKIAEFKLATSELDKDSSTEAWCNRWYGGGWGWNNWCGYRPYYYNWYRPYYYQPGYFNYGYNNYNYGYNYGYNNCSYGWYY